MRYRQAVCHMDHLTLIFDWLTVRLQEKGFKGRHGYLLISKGVNCSLLVWINCVSIKETLMPLWRCMMLFHTLQLTSILHHFIPPF